MTLKVHFATGHLVDLERGVVYRKYTKRGYVALAGTVNNSGYAVVSVSTGNRKSRRTTTVHRMVMEAAMEAAIPPDLDCHHLNGNKLDNRLCNLQLVSRSENVAFAHKAKRIAKEVDGLDSETKLEIVESDGKKPEGKWADELGVSQDAIGHARRAGSVNLPSSVADSIRESWREVVRNH